MNKVVLTGLDVSNRNTKAAVVDNAGNLFPIRGAGTGGSITTAMYQNKETGEWYYDRHAVEAAYDDPDRLITGLQMKSGLDRQDKWLADGTMTSAEAMAKFLRDGCVPLIEAQTGQKCGDIVGTKPNGSPNGLIAIYKNVFKMAGLNALEILNEADAVTYWYNADKKLDHEAVKVINNDVGERTTDVSGAELVNGRFVIRATNGDMNLGARLLQEKLEKRVIENATAKAGMKPFTLDKIESRDRFLFKMRVEEARTSLSKLAKVTIAVPLPTGKRISVDVTNEEYREILKDFMAKVMVIVEKTLKEAGWAPKDVQYVLFTGGMTNHPYVDEIGKQFFGVEPRKDIDRLMAVAYGAAKYGYHRLNRANSLVLPPIDQVTPYAVGVMILPGDSTVPVSHVIFKKGMPAPQEVKEYFQLSRVHYTSCRFTLVQCEQDSQPLSQCHVLGEAAFTDLPIEQVLTSRFELKATFFGDGSVVVHVFDLVSKKTIEIRAGGARAAA